MSFLLLKSIKTGLAYRRLALEWTARAQITGFQSLLPRVCRQMVYLFEVDKLG
jgi:hypothetical protein